MPRHARRFGGAADEFTGANPRRIPSLERRRGSPARRATPRRGGSAAGSGSFLSILGPLAIVGLLAYLLASKGGRIDQAVKRTSAGDLVLVTALALLTLLARTESVVACLNAMGSRPSRIDINAANSLTFLAALINHYVSSIVRAALLQRIDREHSPTILQMVMIDTSTTLIEALVVAVLIMVSASVLRPGLVDPGADRARRNRSRRRRA